jgi:hypothetical protein
LSYVKNIIDASERNEEKAPDYLPLKKELIETYGIEEYTQHKNKIRAMLWKSYRLHEINFIKKVREQGIGQGMSKEVLLDIFNQNGYDYDKAFDSIRRMQGGKTKKYKGKKQKGRTKCRTKSKTNRRTKGRKKRANRLTKKRKLQ